jgi:hypothetical protein
MAVFRCSHLDTFAWLDADSDEAKTLTTYLGYWVCLAEYIEHVYGEDRLPPE